MILLVAIMASGPQTAVFITTLRGHLLILILEKKQASQQTQVQTQTIFQQLDGHRAPPSPLLDVAFVL